MVINTSADRLPRFQQHPTGPEPPGSTASQHGSYKIREEPLGSAKPIRIVIIGAGASGLNMIRTLRLGLSNYELVVYEKNEDVGGTWFENRYPGCRCDVPSHNYQFSWRPNKEWSNFFAPAREIREYLCKMCDEEGMRNAIKTSHRVSSSRWNEHKGIWNITVRNEKTNEEFDDYATFLLDGTGILNNWTWPNVPGLHDFQGTLIHTACWPEDFDHRGKVVAIIGNGSTGVQLIPEIQPGVEKLYHIVRTPTWVIPPRRQTWLMMGNAKELLSEVEVDEKENFSEATISRFKSDADFYRRFVKGIEREVNNAFPVVSARPYWPSQINCGINRTSRSSKTAQCRHLPAPK
jgi:cation diffusion facilitator CzcD-associated flavoprotein CzcO